MHPFFIILLPLLPLLAFLLNGLLGRRLGRAGGWLAVACMGGSATISLILFLGAVAGRVALPIDITLWNWIAAGSLRVSVTDRCVGCGRCTQGVCFVDAIHLHDGRAAIGEACRGCGRCVEVCPESAIELRCDPPALLDAVVDDIASRVDVT